MLFDLITERYSVRNFSDKEPTQQDILKVLEAGRLAPSFLNVQPWHFIVIKDKQNKELLAKLSHGQPHVAKAPVIIACCGDVGAWEFTNYKKTIESKPGLTQEKANWILGFPALNPELLGKSAMEIRTIEELTYPIAYMTLAAQELGMGACIIGSIGNELNQSVPEVYHVVKEELNLPDNMYLMALILLGYPDANDNKPLKSRKTIDQIISYEKFGNKNA